MFLEVVEVSLCERSEGLLAGIDRPREGTVVDTETLDVIGWAFGGVSPAVAVELTADGRVLRNARLGTERPDLAQAFPDAPAASRAGFRTTVEAGAVTELAVRGVLDDGRRIPLATIRLRRRWREDERSPDAALVSVVIPCHDQARFLPEAIDSVLAQSHARFEIVVVDDGSTDNTEAVAGRYTGAQYVRQEHLGLSAARNTGLRLSHGGYLVFLDADDRLLPHALETGLRHLAEHPECAFVAGHCQLTRFDGTPVAGTTPQRRIERDHFRALLKRNPIWSHATVMYRRPVFEQVGVFATTLRACEDYELYLRIAQVFPIFCHGETIAEYRQHSTNMNRDSARMLEAALSALRSYRPGPFAAREDRRAYREGVRFWKRLYGARLAGEARSDLVTPGRRKKGLRALGVLARRYPRGLLSASGGDAGLEA